MPRTFAALTLGWLTPVLVIGPMLAVPLLLPEIFRSLAIGLSFPVLLASGLLYLAAHGLRAARLAVIAVPVLGISGRSACLLHLVTAPGAMILPLKLGEIVRFQQLWQLGKSFPGAVTVILIERSLDAVMLLLLLTYIHSAGTARSVSEVWLLGMTLCAVLAAVVVFVLGPGALRALQRYIVLNHRQARSLRHLGRIDMLRRMTLQAAAILRDQGALLLVLSLLVWALEILAVLLMVGLASAEPSLSATALLLDRILSGSLVLISEGGPTLLFASLALGMLSLTLVWPLAAAIYFRRIPHEPIRRRLHAARPAEGRSHGA